MSLFVQTEVQFIKRLNQLNDAVATPANISFGVPTLTTPEEKLATGKDVKCVITGIGEKYYGSSEIFFNRIDLSTPFANQLVSIDFQLPATTLYDQMHLLNEEFSSTFTENDLENFTFPEGETEGLITLTAKPTSLGWKGSVVLAYNMDSPALVLIPDAHLDGVMTPNDTTLLEQASLRYSVRDFKVHRDWIDLQTPGLMDATQLEALRVILNGTDGTPWVISGESEYSLDGAEIIYNGDDVEYITNRTFANVLVVKLSNKSILCSGTLYLHYSNVEV